MCQPGSSRNNRPTHRGWPGGEEDCSEINSTLRCGCAGNCAFERPTKASIAHAVSRTIPRRRKGTIILGRAPTPLVADSAFGRWGPTNPLVHQFYADGRLNTRTFAVNT